MKKRPGLAHFFKKKDTVRWTRTYQLYFMKHSNTCRGGIRISSVLTKDGNIIISPFKLFEG